MKRLLLAVIFASFFSIPNWALILYTTELRIGNVTDSVPVQRQSNPGYGDLRGFHVYAAPVSFFISDKTLITSKLNNLIAFINGLCLLVLYVPINLIFLIVWDRLRPQYAKWSNHVTGSVLLFVSLFSLSFTIWVRSLK